MNPQVQCRSLRGPNRSTCTLGALGAIPETKLASGAGFATAAALKGLQARNVGVWVSTIPDGKGGLDRKLATQHVAQNEDPHRNVRRLAITSA